jgi:hypothetical protein
MLIQTLFFVSRFARNSQFMSSFCSSTRKNFSSISRSHSVHKSVFISSFSFRWLKRSFAHCFVSLKSYLYVSFVWLNNTYSETECKYTKTFFSGKKFYKNIFNSFYYLCKHKLYTRHVKQEYQTYYRWTYRNH